MKPRSLTPAGKAQVAADINGLPHGRITDHQGAAHVFTASLAELETWFLALGGDITHQPAAPGVVLWTLRTDTDHGNGPTVLVHAPALDTDQLDADCADTAVTKTLVVTRHQCPHCRRYTRADKARVEQHMARCWKNPANRTCKGCTHFQPAYSLAPDPEYPAPPEVHEVPAACGADVDLPDLRAAARHQLPALVPRHLTAPTT